jgi:hypothetical protein
VSSGPGFLSARWDPLPGWDPKALVIIEVYAGEGFDLVRRDRLDGRGRYKLEGCHLSISETRRHHDAAMPFLGYNIGDKKGEEM